MNDSPDFSPPTVRIFVNAHPVDAQPHEPVIEAISRWDSEMATTLRSAARALTDSRGIVTPLDTPVHGGAIFRVVSNRQLREAEGESPDDPFADA